MTWFLLALLSAVLSAAAAVLQKKTLRHVGELDFSFWLSVVTLVGSCVIPLFCDVTDIAPSTLSILVFKAMLNAGAFLCVMTALRQNDISTALPLLALSPGITAIIEMLFLGAPIFAREWCGIILMTIGTLVLEGYGPLTVRSFLPSSALGRSRVFIVSALLLFAISAVVDKELVTTERVHPLVNLFYQHVVFFVVFGCIFLIRRRPSDIPLFVPDLATIAILVAIGAITFGYREAQLEAMKGASAALVLAVKRTSVIFAAAIGGQLWSEKNLWEKLIGAALIVAAGFLILRNIQ